MSEVMLNILDGSRECHGTVHGGFADTAVAALSAEPETIEELRHAITRFQKPLGDSSTFSGFDAGTDFIPWDAGIVIIDLAARVVAMESSYSQPAAAGNVRYHNGREATGVNLEYRVPEDWLFADSVNHYEGVCKKRRAERMTARPFDARPVLYNEVLEFIVGECLAARAAKAGDPIAEIHARWLMTPRADLQGQSPRDVLLGKREWIDADLELRERQWSLLREPPPCLPKESSAYRFAGFGTHEIVLYYELMRHLLSECWKRVSANGEPAIVEEVARLKQIEKDWLDTPEPDFPETSPSCIMECERRRQPLVVSVRDIFIDEDCPCCRAMSEHSGPTFWHVDGCNMDFGFPFSFHHTREEWEEEEGSWAG